MREEAQEEGRRSEGLGGRRAAQAAFAALSSDYADADAMHIQGSPSFVLNEGRQKLYGNVGFRVMEAASAAETLELLEREQVDLILSDIRMPGMDGIEVARRIKASRPWLPVVIVTGYGTGENEAAAREAGVSAFLKKPLSPEAIEKLAAYLAGLK